MWMWQNDTMPWKGDRSIKKLVYERMAIHMIQWDMSEWQNESVIYQQKRTECLNNECHNDWMCLWWNATMIENYNDGMPQWWIVVMMKYHNNGMPLC